MGYTPNGRRPEQARRLLEIIRHLAASKGTRPGKFKFKTPENAPHPDTLKIVLTGKHIPDTMLRLARWSAERHGIRTGKT